MLRSSYVAGNRMKSVEISWPLTLVTQQISNILMHDEYAVGLIEPAGHLHYSRITGRKCGMAFIFAFLYLAANLQILTISGKGLV